MPELVAMIQTTWPKIRVGLYRWKHGRFQFVEEGIQTDGQGNHSWFHYFHSGLYDDFETAKNAMVEHYCSRTEDEYTVDPNSVTILYPPDFTGAHHPVLIADRGTVIWPTCGGRTPGQSRKS